MKFANLYILIFACLCSVSQAVAQSTSVGNGSAIGPSAGERENYGVNSPSSTTNQNTFVTRHNRRGNNSGIGSSFWEQLHPLWKVHRLPDLFQCPQRQKVQCSLDRLSWSQLFRRTVSIPRWNHLHQHCPVYLEPVMLYSVR